MDLLGIPLQLLGGLSAGGLLLIVALLIFTGKLVPVGTVDRLLAAAAEKADLYQTAYMQQREAGQTESIALRTLIEQGATQLQILEALRKAVEQGMTTP